MAQPVLKALTEPLQPVYRISLRFLARRQAAVSAPPAKNRRDLQAGAGHAGRAPAQLRLSDQCHAVADNASAACLLSARSTPTRVR